MRWDDLFADLGAQLDAAEAAELAGEVTDRTRREQAALGLADRLRAQLQAALAVTTRGAGQVHGRLLDVGTDWLLLEEAGRSELVLSTAHVLALGGIGARSEAPGSEGEVARRLDLAWALRGLARSRVGVQVVLVDGSVLSGTFDRVGSDHLDLAEHGAGEARRAAAVRQVRVLPLSAIVLVRSWA